MIPHNYYPPSINLPHYVANESSVLSLIFQFGVLWAAVSGISFALICYLRPSLSLSDRVAFVWMCLSISSLFLMNNHREISPLMITSGIHPSIFRRPFCCQSCSTCWSPRPVWPVMERILPFRLPLFDVWCILGQHGNCDCGMWKSWSVSWKQVWQSLDIVLLGTTGLSDCILYCRAAPRATCFADCHIVRSSLRWCTLLRHKFARYLLLPTGRVLFLVLLLFLQLHLDGDRVLYVWFISCHIRLPLISSRLCETKCYRGLEGFRKASKTWWVAKDKMTTHAKKIEVQVPKGSILVC